MVFADRTQWDLNPNEITAAMKQLKDSKKELLDLTKSNPTRCGFLYPQEAILEAYLNNENLSYVPESQGMLSARKAVADYYAAKNIFVDPEDIFLTASTSEGYALLFKLLANPNDGILFPRPSYPLFQFLCDTNDVAIEYYPLRYDQKWHFPESFVPQQINPLKAFVIVNPNNPTGSIISSEELQRVNEYCQEQNMPIICDEVFFDYLFDEKQEYLSLAQNKKVLTFTLGGLSKTLAMPQMKLSWIIVSGPKDCVKQAKEKLEVICDTYLSVNTPVQNALKPLLSQASMIQNQLKTRMATNLRILQEQVESFAGITSLAADGGWYAVLQVSNLHNEEAFILDLIKKDYVLVHPGYFYDFEDEGYIVLSLIVEEQIFAEGVKRFLERVKSL